MPPTLKPAISFVEKKDLDPAKLVRLFQQAPWAKGRTLEDAREMLRHTDVTVMAWDGDVLIGFGRVLTDYVYRATIWDVIVDKAYHGLGVGTDIVQRILNHPRL
jgi:GNAT superfamily N-acetyltransferase